MKRVSIIILSIMLTLFFSAASSFGTVDKGSGYGYTITIYAGQQGHFGSDKNNTTKKIQVKAGAAVTIDLDKLDYHLDNDEYYVRGLRQTGHDNDEIKSLTIPSVDEDISYEVAYGIKGGMVKYVVNYVAAKDGEELHDSDTYYGMVGDKPVVSYKYVENYLPDAYNKGKTLSADESLNVYTFTYSYTGKSNNGGDNDSDNDNDGDNTNGNNNGNNNGANNGAANANAPGGNATANADGTNIADNDTPQAAPSDFVDLDDPDAPLADGSDQEDKDSGSKLPLLIGGGIGVLLLACIAYALARRRREE